MVRFGLLTFILLLSFGCAHDFSRTETSHIIVIDDFDQLNENVGSTVTLDGFISSAHEANGLYLQRSDIHELNSRCVEIQGPV